MSNIKISIIIVSYNVRPFLINSLESIIRALAGLSHEIIVIDNGSVDGSAEMISKRYPGIIFIANQQNAGFAAANNQGLARANGDYLVLINPDTLVQEDSFTSLIQFMESSPRAGAVTCKILNPDGSFSIDSRHSIPSPMTAFWKQIGFSRLFPKSRRFARYNMTFLDENERNRVDAISGSFMFLRAEAVKEVGMLDEDYFMYCEDVDYCYRVGRAGWEIHYLPVSNIIHYKGESTSKQDYRYALNFSRSLYLFYNKHFHHRYFFILQGFILIGVFFRGIIIYLYSMIRSFGGYINYKFGLDKKKRSKDRTLLVCRPEEAERLIRELARMGIHLSGLVSPDAGSVGQSIGGQRIVASLDRISVKTILDQADKIIFSAEKISYKQIIKTIASPALRKTPCRIIPPGSDLIIGKGEVTEFAPKLSLL